MEYTACGRGRGCGCTRSIALALTTGVPVSFHNSGFAFRRAPRLQQSCSAPTAFKLDLSPNGPG
jgi:hypothetical protein